MRETRQPTSSNQETWKNAAAVVEAIIRRSSSSSIDADSGSFSFNHSSRLPIVASRVSSIDYSPPNAVVDTNYHTLVPPSLDRHDCFKMPPKRTARGNYNGSISRRSNSSTNRTAAITPGRTAATSSASQSNDENPYVGKQCVHEHLAGRLSICRGKDLWMPSSDRLKSCINKCSDSRIMHPKVVEMLRTMAQNAKIYDKFSKPDMEVQYKMENKDNETKIIRYGLLRFLCRMEMVGTRGKKMPSAVSDSLKEAQSKPDLISKHGKEFLLILREGVLSGDHSDDESAELAGLVAKCLICCGLLSDDYEDIHKIHENKKRVANERKFQVLFSDLGIPQPQEMPTEGKKPVQITVDKKWVQVRTFFHEFFGNRLADPVVNRIYGKCSKVASTFDKENPYSQQFKILHEQRIAFCWKVCTESEEPIAKLKAKSPPASETTTGTSGRSASSDNIAPHSSSKGYNTVNLPSLDDAVASPAEKINPEDLEKARACFSILERYGDSLPTKKSIEDIHRLIDGDFVEKGDGEAEADGESEDYLYLGDDPALTEYALKTFSAEVSIPMAKHIDYKYQKKKLCVSLAAQEIHKELNNSKKYLIGAGVSLKEIVAFLLHEPSKPAPNAGTQALCTETAEDSEHNQTMEEEPTICTYEGLLQNMLKEEELDVTRIGQFIYNVANVIDAISTTGNVIHNNKPVNADMGLGRPIATAEDGETEGVGTRGHKSNAAQKGTYDSKSAICDFGISLKRYFPLLWFLTKAARKGDTVARAIRDLMNAMTCDNPITAEQCVAKIKEIMGDTIIY